MKEFEINDIIEVTVSGISRYGIFVATNNEYIGMIHISEISDSFVKNINDYVNVGDKIYTKILDIDNKEKKLKLSIKCLNYKNVSDCGRNSSLNKNDKLDNGFSPLAENLDKWINDKILELDSDC